MYFAPLATKQCHELPTALLYVVAVLVTVVFHCDPVHI